MKLYICVDDNMGMAFNKRRQSRDSALCEEIVREIAPAKLMIGTDSALLFEQMPESVEVCDILSAPEAAICFAEKSDAQELSQRAEEIVLCRWNRSYPSDLKLDVNFSDFELENARDIVGNSHEKITLEYWRRK